MKHWIASILCLPAVVAIAQNAPAQIAFEVASIKPASPQPMGRMLTGMNTDGSMLRYSNASLKDVIRMAYRVQDTQVEGPDWLSNARFDIQAKLPDGSTRDQVPEMLQTLLADRFKLALQSDIKERRIYALVVGKGGPKLKAADSANDVAPRAGVAMTMGSEGVHVTTPAATLTALAETISRFSDRPVVDMTGIPGRYDFDLVFSPDTLGALPASRSGGASEALGTSSTSIYESVRDYGLKLEPRKAPMNVLRIDHIERTPTEN
jgi:uncharacterized protein (TIGR03435 family)